ALVTSHSQGLSGLAHSTTYYYRAISKDSSGNEVVSDEANFTTTEDVTPPNISNVQHSGITSNSATVTWDTDEASTSQVEYGTTSTTHGSYDSTTGEDTTLVTSHTVNVGGLSASTTYYYRVISKDFAGNDVWSAEGSFTTPADTSQPNISNVNSSGIDSNSATITWDTDEPATSQVTYDTASHAAGTYADGAAARAAYGSWSPEDTTEVASHNMALGGLTLSTTYYYRVISRDAAGNETVSDEYSFTTTGDTTAPTISAVAASGETDSAATISWNTNEPATSQVEYGTVSGTYDFTTTLDPALQGSHSVTLSGLAASTTYYYRVISRDGSGNEARSTEESFTTTADTTPPTISGEASSGVTHDSASVTWDTDEPATSQVAYSTTSHSVDPGWADIAAVLAAYGSSTPEDTGLVLSHSDSITGLAVSTTYYYRVLSKDASGNEAWSAEQSFTTTADVTPPEISNVDSSGITDSQATISWNTNELATSQVVYSTATHAGDTYADGAAARAAYGTWSPEDVTLVSIHNVALGGLTLGTTYYYRVISRDTAGNEKVSDESFFTTTGDVTPPTISGEAESGITDSGATISWNTNEPATSQVEYGTTSAEHGGYDSTTTLDANLLGSHSVTLAGLAASTTYYYRVISQDGAENEAWSAERSFTTTADTVAPVIDPASVTASDITDRVAKIAWSTDELSTSQVAYSTTSHPGDIFSSIAEVLAAYGSSTPEDTGLVQSHSDSLVALLASTTYYYRVMSKDASGNEVWSDEKTFDTVADTFPPSIVNVLASGLSSSTATITWNTDELATSQVAYSTTSQPGPFADIAALLAAYGSSTTEDPNLVTNHNQLLSPLLPGTTYYYRVISKDGSGYGDWSDEGSFTTEGLNIVPGSVVATPDPNGTAVTITWNTNTASDSQVEYGLTTPYDTATPLDPVMTTSHRMTIIGLVPGTTYHYSVVSRDALGQVAQSADSTFTTAADTVPPEMPDLIGPADNTLDDDVTPTFDWSDVTDPSGVTYSLEVHDGTTAVISETGLADSYFTLTTPLPEGVYTWKVQAVDGAGNQSGWTAPWTYICDLNAPVVTVTSPVVGDAWRGGSSHDITWTIVDVALKANSISIDYFDGSAWLPIASGEANDGSYAWTVPSLDIFNARVRVTAEDQMDRSGSGESGDFIIDSTPPTVTIDNLPYHPASPILTPTFNGTAVDTAPVTSVEYRILTPDGTVEVDWSDATGTMGGVSVDFTFTTPTLTEGWHLLEVRATDAVGNEGAASYNPDGTPPGFLVTTKPLVKFDDTEPMSAHPPKRVKDLKTSDPSPIFKGEATSPAAAIESVWCSIDGGTWAEATFKPDADPKSGTWEFTPAPLSDGTHSIQVKARNIAGGETPAEVYAEGGAGYFTFTIDITPPGISNIMAIDVSSSSAVITWTTDEPATSIVEYGKDTGYGSTAGDDTNLTTEHRVEITGLSHNSEYHFVVKSADDVGNEAVSDDQVFKTSVAMWFYAVIAVGGVVGLAIVLSVVWFVVRRIFR
ncbi:fibronectin type III domain-containing protein, partial [Chloroflexota bacterium]